MSDGSLLPPNATAPERAIEGAVIRSSGMAMPIRQVWNPDTAPGQLLPWLAWAFSVDQWSTAWDDTQKRAAIKASVEIHRRKGTIGAVRQALAALDYRAEVQEWFAHTPALTPYTFRLRLEADQTGYDLDDLVELVALIDSVKNLRSQLDSIVPTVRSVAALKVGAVSNVGSDFIVEFGGPGGLLRANGRFIADGTQNADGIING